MKTIEKIIISSIVGTTFMTLYSYQKAKRDKEKYVEPELLNELIDNSKSLPDIQKEETNPLGWGIHYATGFSFVAAYWVLWKKALVHPTIPKTFIVGSLSGIAGILVWKTLLANHDNPPRNDRESYYKQLFAAHIVFSAFALATYKGLDYIDRKSETEQ